MRRPPFAVAGRVPRDRARPLAVAAGLAALAAAPFAFGGHERGHYWRVAWHELAANPVLGSGAGTFVDWWLRLRTVPQSTHEAHSLYLETLAELGPLGLALLLLVFAAGLAGAWRLRRERLGPALLAALVTYDLAAAVDFHWELAAVTAPAIVLAASAAVHADGQAGMVRSRYAVPALAALTVAGVLALAGNAALLAGDPQRAALCALLVGGVEGCSASRGVRAATAQERCARTAARLSSTRTTGARGASSPGSRKASRAASRWRRRRGSIRSAVRRRLSGS